jgi:hypothetical protein
VLLAAGLSMGYQWDEPLAYASPSETWYVGIIAAVVLAAGVCTLVPAARWLVGSGLLLGVAAASTRGLLYLVVDPMEGGGGFGNGYRVELVAHLLLVVAAGVAGVALARSGEYRLTPRSAGRGLSRLVIGIGVAGSVALLLHDMRIWNIGLAWYWVAPSVWLTVLALAVPAVAAVAAPRRFGVFLLFGWIGGAVANFAAYFAYADKEIRNGGYDIGRTPILLFGATLVALLIVAVLDARSESGSASS